MPFANVSSEIAGFRLASAFASSMAFRVKAPRLAYCFIALVVHDRRGVRNCDRRAISRPMRNSLSNGEFGRRQLDRGKRPSELSEISRILRTNAAFVVAVGQNRDLLFLQLRKRLDLLVGRAEQQHYVVLEDGPAPAPRGGTFCVGAQHGKIGLPYDRTAPSAFAAIGVGHDFEGRNF